MKHRWLAVAIILFFFAAGAAQTAIAAVTLYVDDTLVTWEHPAFVTSGSVMVPITVAEEYLGADLRWSPGDTKAEVAFDDKELVLEAGRVRTLVNGEYISMEPYARMDQGFLMVPLRFLVNHLGMRMNFDGSINGLRITRTEAQRALGEARPLLIFESTDAPEAAADLEVTEPMPEMAAELAEPEADQEEKELPEAVEEPAEPRRVISILERPTSRDAATTDTAPEEEVQGPPVEDEPAVTDVPPADEGAVVETPQRRIVTLLERPSPKFGIESMAEEEAVSEESGQTFTPGEELSYLNDWREQLRANGILRVLPDAGIGVDEGPQDLTAIHYEGGPRSNVRIDVEHFDRYQTVLLVEPDRLVLDLHGVQGEGLPEQIIDGPLIQRIRSSRFDDETIRIVFDLHTSTGYEVRHWPDGGLEVEFNYHITNVYLERDGLEGQPQLHIGASDHPEYTVIQLIEPRRIVLDFHNATLVGGAQETLVQDGRVQRVRVSQFIPSTTRVVLDLEDEVTPLAMTAGAGEYILNLFEGSQAEARIYQARVARETQISSDYDATRIDLPSHPPRSVRREGAALSGYVVVVDPGHGGSDPGAIGPRGTFEKDVVLDISLYLGALLAEAGAEVVFTRTTDKYVSIFERPQMAIHAGADILVSVHANSYIGNSARGTETLYHPKDVKNQLLAQSIQTELVRAVELMDRGLRRRTDLAILNHSHIPAALVEVGFINHREEELLLRSSGFQQVAAEGIFNGIVKYFESIAR